MIKNKISKTTIGFILLLIVFLPIIIILISYSGTSEDGEGEVWSVQHLSETQDLLIKNNSNQRKLILYGSPENYLTVVNETTNETGYKPINETIIPQSIIISGRDYTLGVEKGIYYGYFREMSSDVKDRPMAMIKDNYILTFSPVDKIQFIPHKATKSGDVGNKQQSTSETEENKVTYPNQYKKIGYSEGFANLTYKYLNTLIKEELVIWDKDYLNERFDLQCNEDEYNITSLVFKNIVRAYKTDDEDSKTLGIYYGKDRKKFKDFGKSTNDEKTTNEEVYFTDENNETVYFVPVLYAYDSNGTKIMLNKTISMTDFGNLKVEIEVPFKWLNETAIFPVIIDPTIKLDDTSTEILADIYAIGIPTILSRATQIKFGNLSQIPTTATINSAELCLYVNNCGIGGCPDNDASFERVLDYGWEEGIDADGWNAQSTDNQNTTQTWNNTVAGSYHCIDVKSTVGLDISGDNKNTTIRIWDADYLFESADLVIDDNRLHIGKDEFPAVMWYQEDRENSGHSGNTPYLVIDYTLPTPSYEVLADVYSTDAEENKEFQIKFNISAIPSTSTVNSVDLCVYTTECAGGGCIDTDANFSRVLDYGWEEDGFGPDEWNAQSTDTVTSSETWNNTVAETWWCLNVTAVVEKDISGDNKNTTIRIEDLDYPAGDSFEVTDDQLLYLGNVAMWDIYNIIEDRENTGTSGNTPYLVIDYTNPFIINECGILSIENGVYTLNKSVNTTTTCFIITANNLTLDFAGYDITGDDGEVDAGVRISARINDTSIKNGFIYNFGGSNEQGVTTGNYCLRANITNMTLSGLDVNSWTEGFSIRDVIMTSGKGIYFDGASYNHTFTNVYINGGDIETFGSGEKNLLFINITLINGNDDVASGSVNTRWINCTMTATDSAEDGFFYNIGVNNTWINCNLTATTGYPFGLDSGSKNNFIQDSYLRGVAGTIKSTGGSNNTLLNVTYASGDESVTGGELIRKWYFDANVTNASGVSLQNANVSAYNVTGSLVFSELTNVNGRIIQQELIEYINNKTKIYHSPFTINTSLETYITNSTIYNLTIENNVFHQVSLMQDITPPLITINSPTNITYTTSYINLSVAVSDSSLNQTWFNLDNSFNDTLYRYMYPTVRDSYTDNSSKWTESWGNGDILTNSTNKKVGEMSILVNRTSAGSVSMNYYEDYNLNLNASGSEYLEFWWYSTDIDTEPGYGDDYIEYMRLYTTDGNNYFQELDDIGNNDESPEIWKLASVNLSKMSSTGSPSLENIDRIEFVINSLVGTVGTQFFIDNLRFVGEHNYANFNLSLKLSDGSHNVIVYAKDLAGNENKSAMRYFTILTKDTTNPLIPYVDNSSSITLTGGTTTTVYIHFNATDETSLNLTTGNITLSKSGETNRISSICVNETSSSPYIINCSIIMNYWDSAGNWLINTTIKDTSNNVGRNSTQYILVNTLSYITLNESSINWTHLNPNQDDQESDVPVVIFDKGNQDFTTSQITSSNMTYNSNTILSTNFSASPLSNQVSGQTYLSDAGITYSDFSLIHGENQKEDIFIYMDTEILGVGFYQSISPWSVDPA